MVLLAGSLIVHMTMRGPIVVQSYLRMHVQSIEGQYFQFLCKPTFLSGRVQNASSTSISDCNDGWTLRETEQEEMMTLDGCDASCDAAVHVSDGISQARAGIGRETQEKDSNRFQFHFT